MSLYEIITFISDKVDVKPLTYDAGPTRDLAGEATLCVVSGPASRVK